MQINKIDNTPSFQAKLIVGDERIQKYIKSSFMANSRKTFDILDKFSAQNPDAIVSLNIKNLKNRDYLVAKNGITGKSEAKLLHDKDILKLEDRTSFIDLVEKVMNKKSFWISEPQETSYFDATALPVKIEHDVFKLEK